MSPTVLLIGDRHQIRRVLTAHLLAEGFQVLIAPSVHEALELFDREIVDILVMDMRAGVRSLGSFTRLDASVKCCFISGGGYRLSDLETDTLAVVTLPLRLPEIAETLWRLVLQPDLIVDESDA